MTQMVRGENQANVVTGCHVISMPGLCGALGVNSFTQRVHRQMWTPKAASTPINLLTGSRGMRALPECTVNTGHPRTTKCQRSSTCGQAEARLERLERSILRTTRTHTPGGLEKRGTRGYLVVGSKPLLRFRKRTVSLQTEV